MENQFPSGCFGSNNLGLSVWLYDFVPPTLDKIFSYGNSLFCYFESYLKVNRHLFMYPFTFFLGRIKNDGNKSNAWMNTQSRGKKNCLNSQSVGLYYSQRPFIQTYGKAKGNKRGRYLYTNSGNATDLSSAWPSSSSSSSWPSSLEQMSVRSGTAQHFVFPWSVSRHGLRVRSRPKTPV